MSAIATSFARATASYSAPRYAHVKWLWSALNWRRGAVISVEGVAPSVGACGTGKEEDGVGVVWIT